MHGSANRSLLTSCPEKVTFRDFHSGSSVIFFWTKYLAGFAKKVGPAVLAVYSSRHSNSNNSSTTNNSSSTQLGAHAAAVLILSYLATWAERPFMKPKRHSLIG